MTSVKQEPRVWHINGAKYMWQKHDWCSENQLDIDETVKVVEYSAYEKALERIEKLETALGSIIKQSDKSCILAGCTCVKDIARLALEPAPAKQDGETK